MDRRGAHSDEIAEDVQKPLGKSTIFAQNQDPRAAVEKFCRFRDVRIQPIDVVREQGRE